MRAQNDDAPTPPWVLLGTVLQCRRKTLVAVFLVALGLWFYAKKMTERGVLT